MSLSKVMSRGTTRRRFLVGGVAFAGLLAACGAPATPTPEPTKPAAAPSAATPATGAAKPAASGQVTTIQFYEYGSALDKEIADGIIADFEKAQSAIKVSMHQPTGDHYTKLQTELAGGLASDVWNNQTWKWQPFAAKGVLEPLDELASRDKYTTPWPEVWKTTYDPQTKFRGKRYAVPYNMGAMMIFYSKDQFDKANLKYPTDDWTYEQFTETAQKLTRTDAGVKYYGYQTNTSYERLACWMRLDGAKEWDTEVEPKKSLWTEPSIVQALNWQLYEVMNTIKASPTPAEIQGGSNQLQNGNVAMKMEGPWFLWNMQGPKAVREGGTRFDVVLNPKGKTGKPVHMVFGHNQVMYNGSKVKDATWEFMKFSGSPSGQKHVAQSGRQPNSPETNKEFWEPMARAQFNFENTKAFLTAFETGIVHLAGEIDDTYLYNEVLKAAFDAMVAGQTTAKDILPEVNSKIQTILDAYWAKQPK